MTKLPFETFLDDVMPELPGCPTDLALRHIRRTLNDFGFQTRYLTVWLDPISTTAGGAAYGIVPTDTDLQLVRPEEVRYNGDELDPVSVDELNTEEPAWRTETGEPRVYTREDDDQIKLVYIPTTSTTDALRVKVSVTPDFDATGFAKVFYDRFADGIAAGVKARLMSMPKKPWSDPATAEKYLRDYQVEVDTAKHLADKSLSGARRRTRTYYR